MTDHRYWLATNCMFLYPLSGWLFRAVLQQVAGLAVEGLADGVPPVLVEFCNSLCADIQRIGEEEVKYSTYLSPSYFFDILRNMNGSRKDKS